MPIGFDLKLKTIEFPDYPVEAMVNSLFMYIESKIHEVIKNKNSIEIDWIKDHFFSLDFLQQLLKKHKNVTKEILDAKDCAFNTFSSIYSRFEKTDTNKEITKMDFENFTYCMPSDLSLTLKSETIKRVEREKFTGDYYSFDNIEPLIRRHKLITYYATTLKNGCAYLIEVFLVDDKYIEYNKHKRNINETDYKQEFSKHFKNLAYFKKTCSDYKYLARMLNFFSN